MVVNFLIKLQNNKIRCLVKKWRQSSWKNYLVLVIICIAKRLCIEILNLRILCLLKMMNLNWLILDYQRYRRKIHSSRLLPEPLITWPLKLWKGTMIANAIYGHLGFCSTSLWAATFPSKETIATLCFKK